MNKVTIKDVAREACVSIGTVSNALNGGRYISESTKKRVMEAVEKLQYVPNLNGRYLKAGATKMLGFFTSSAAGAYFGTLIDYLSRECWKMGYNLSVYVTRDTSVIMENLMGKRLDGALIFEDIVITDTEIDRIQKEGLKVVFLDREVEGEGISSIVFDSYQAGYEATRYLINLGHKKIAFIEGRDNIRDSVCRYQGYLAAMQEYKLFVPQHYTIKGRFEEEFTFHSVKNYIAEHAADVPDAFVAGNDLSAIGCIKALQTEGFRVPEDVSVIGFDDIEISQYFAPPLTTMRNPIARQAVEAVDLLVNMIKEEQEGVLKKLDGSIIVRESSTRCVR